MNARPLALALAGLVALAARPASAQTSPPSSVPPPLRAEGPRPEAPVQLVGQLGLDLGFEKLIGATMDDGSTSSLKANQGVNGSVGLAFLKLDGGRFATQATIGVEYSTISASNGSARWLAYPLEVMELAYLDPLRFGAGFSYLLSPSVKGDGFFDSIGTVPFKNSLGIVLEADWVLRAAQSARGARYTLGVRYVIQKLEAKAGGDVMDANAVGFTLGFTG